MRAISSLTGSTNKALLLSMLCLLSLAVASYAWAGGTSLGDSETQNSPGLLRLLSRLALSLVLIIVLIWGMVYLLRRISSKKGGSSDGDIIRVLDRSFIAPKKAIYLVRVAGKVIALGVTDSQINMLAELPSEETLSMYPHHSQGSPFMRDFKRRLNLWRNKAADDKV